MDVIFETIGIFVLIYFTLLNLNYMAFTLIAWQTITQHLRSHSYAGLDEIFASPLTPPISILLPAYNESAGVVESVRSLLRLRYPQFEVVVVNDGSKDNTVEVMVEAFEMQKVTKALRPNLKTKEIRACYISPKYPELILVDKENGGKADALNAGVTVSRFPYVCAIDADAVLEENALLSAAKPLLDYPRTSMASGGIVRIANGCRIERGEIKEVGLPSNLWAMFQVVEYFRAFLVGRVGWSKIGALLIISGAFGIFRRSAVEEVGGWWTETVGEDMELVMRIHHHYLEKGQEANVFFFPDPVCWTEAPESRQVLGRQRRRWQRGLGEGLFRHKAMFLNPRYKWVGGLAYPYFVFFEFLGPVIELFGYILLPIAYFLGYLSINYLIAFSVMAILLGVLLSISALALEEFSFRRHQKSGDIWKLAIMSILENFGYRQLTSWWRVRALLDLFKGEHQWGEMTRKGLGAQQPPKVEADKV